MTASATLVDPRRLPVPLSNPARRALIGAGHVWVLHRIAVLRVLLALVLLAVAAGLYQVREHIALGAATVGELAQSQFAEAGFAIAQISFAGQGLTAEADLFAALALEPQASTLNFDAEAARERIMKLPAVETATIRKIYPGNVEVEITEKTPVARWRIDGVTFLVDQTGAQIAEAGDGFSGLPLVIGDGAADDAMVMIRALERHSALNTGIVALSRIGDRRWDIVYRSGLRVQLPEMGVAQALVQLETYQNQYALLDRDLTLIDLRVPGIVALRQTVREDE
ncbi:FtsQ-type POTRA domain-containing protein [Arsenicitalea aurantiaca]|uniref:Cell division protein FtsQ n=1 Tax=Arsenicitalea aurantiaca TaxID=1783274 RepID=A0A433XM09_9HYPH|nr:FtsQ-type POTRA domain-containing protein [Arsenicitalea aurantiaca]RUT35125.1 FtsQ-type POTRA domain-containing protein [Arsenicitalea aurantiaca]